MRQKTEGKAPTCRDLAQQVHEVIAGMRRHLAAPAIRSALIVGGTDPRASQAQLQGGAHIVTGTPGALLRPVMLPMP